MSTFFLEQNLFLENEKSTFWGKKATCRNTGLNQGPSHLQSNALPTELFRPLREVGTR